MAVKYLNELINSNSHLNILDRIRNWSCNKENGFYEDKIKSLALNSKTANNNNFPNEDIIDEYMNYAKSNETLIAVAKIQWTRPNLKSFQVLNFKIIS